MYNDYFFISQLSGSQEVPPVRTDADGLALFHVSSDQKKIIYRLAVHDLRNMTQAHIHLGQRNINGPIVAFLFGPIDHGTSTNNKVIEGILTAKDLVGPLMGKPLSELVDLMSAGKTYVNVHTTQFPDGEIRGKIKQQ
ncbi:CHRD domain-containing protein [Oceanobacillus longus]|uniref:CHRD domain-containing protein n=1 Tax=Oceanobacillus longus TaxID=930120 RepID=A0ABV8GUH5_9BACI